MKKLVMNFNAKEGYYIEPVFMALSSVAKKYGFEITTSDLVPYSTIKVDDSWFAFIVYSDYPNIGAISLERIATVDDIRIIFKFQHNPQWDYSKEISRAERVVPAGYFFTRFDEFDVYHQDRDSLLGKDRDIDIVAGMRWHCKPGRNETPFLARAEIHKAALRLKEKGLKVLPDKIKRAGYFENLFRTKIGFNWRGCGALTFRIIEYICAGVVMITDPIKSPIREDVVLEDGVHCIFCDDPKKFEQEAVLMLKDKIKMERIRRLKFSSLLKNKQ